MEKETHQASENMKLFFKKLLDVKALVKQKAEEEGSNTLKEIYQKLDAIIKEKK